MNSKQITFLRLLLEQEEHLPAGYYGEKLHVSDKTVRRMIPDINAYMAAYNGSVHSCPGAGIRLEMSGHDRERLLNSISMLNMADSGTLWGSWNQLSRRMDIALNLLLYSDETTSLSSLSYRYYVSKSSIAGDLKALEPFAEKHHLIICQNRHGTSLKGKESSLREALAELLLYIIDNNMDSGARYSSGGLGVFDAETLMTILDIFTEDDLNFV